jgi:hypothetical protein
VEKAEAQIQRKEVAHAGGTVNIFLANGNGLVAVTDSRLSSNNVPVGYGTKLFKVDDKTICSIAGWYLSAGPTMDGVTYPAYSTVPNVIQTIVARYPSMSTLPITRKIEILSESVAFTLNIMERMAQAEGEPSNTEPSEITVAMSDGNSLQIARTDIVPNRESGKVVYRTISHPVQTVHDVFVYSLAGKTEVGESILSERKLKPNDPILGYYYREIERDKGKSLSLVDMQQLAKQIERLTALDSPRLVGGPIQMANIDHGEARIIDKPEIPSTQRNPLFNYFGNGIINGVPNAYTGGIEVRGESMGFFLGYSHLSYVKQDLNGLFIFDTVFDHCRLRYDGSSFFIFSKSNTVLDSTLELTGNANPNSAAVRKIRKDFPQLDIIDHHVKVN